MRRIGIIPTTVIVAVWVFFIGFTFGYLNELEAGTTTATNAGLLSGAAALALGAATYLVVKLVRAVTHARRGHDAKHAG
ncbi:hypothetical protein PX701_09235 [Agromyces sp. H3Y2-19a]|uniref:hypothetical protein n=1 Tax=Agromyces TaxID=33877 RepID=UPI001E2DF3CA|nr:MULTISPECIES: hypothetical protein [Agromyces]MCD5345018.1 hypothetical protein [Agromyces sp. S2-1-8]MDF0513801.1 hypothetical protein [Agromyces chromiiresistens]